MASPSLDRRLGLTGNKAYKAPCDVATTTNITLSGEQTIDGVLTSGSRVLVWNQTNAVDNGIWDSSTGSWSRAIDCNTNQDLAKGTQVYVSGGTTYAGNRFVFTSSNPIQPGTSSITITQSTDSSTLQARLADPTSASNGAGMIGFAYALSYASGTVGRWLKDLATSAGAGLIGYLLNATGAVLRTLSLKLSECPSVLDFGAVADGNASTGAGTDNSAAFQLAEAYCYATGKTIYIPAGTYILRSQVTVRSGVNFIGHSMYSTILIAPNTFTGDGLIKLTGGSGVPSSIKSCAVLGATATGAGAGSVGVKLIGNACKVLDCWVGGFFAQINMNGTDCHCIDCWCDVSLASGYGLIIDNGGNIAINTVVFNCYVGFYISADGYWGTTEPDTGVRLIGCQAIQCGYDGLNITRGLNVQILGMQFHSPTAASKFTNSFITIDGGSNITIVGAMGTFGNVVSSSCTGVRQVNETFNLKISNSNITGANNGYVIANAPLGIISGNSAMGCKTWGFIVSSGSIGLAINNNQSSFNGTTNATDGGGYFLTNASNSGKWRITSNSAADFGSTSKYGFYVSADANAAAKINLGLNAVTNTSNAYTITGTAANVTQTANI